jgi:uncharacterized protein (TIGR00290 family)
MDGRHSGEALLNKPRAWMSWSSGKDSALALHVARTSGEVEIVALLTTINETHARVAMHAVREALLEAQAAALGLPLVKVPIPSPCPNAVYEERIGEAMKRAHDEGVREMVFGDLFLEDLRAYREKQLAAVEMRARFPLWQRRTAALAREMIDLGMDAILTCVDPRVLPKSFAGRHFDRALLADLPSTVDPCGENGEFHTFTCAGPMFRAPIPVETGEVVERDGFVFADVLLKGTKAG